MKAYLQFGPWGGPYQTVLADDVKESPCGPNPYAMGYGRKIPMPYMIRYQGQWRRVYVCCYGNSGVPWVYVNGVETVVDIERD